MAALVQPPLARFPFVDPGTGFLQNQALRFLQQIARALNGSSTNDIATIGLGIGISVSAAAGTPNGVVNGNPGDLYLNTSGGAGTTFWVKESGVATKTGWVGK